MAQDILVPDIGDFHDVEVIDVLVKVGDRVDIDTPLITVETEKASMDVPSTAAGVIKSLAVKKGDRVNKGSVIVSIDAAGASAAAPAPTSTPTPTQSQAPAAAPAAAPSAAAVEQAVTVPAIGDFKEVEVIDVLVKVGDRVEVDTPLVTLETEKASMDVPSTVAGVVKSVAVKKGDRVGQGSVLVQLSGVAGGAPAAAPATPAAAPKSAAAPAPASTPTPPATKATPPAATIINMSVINEAGFAKAHAGPSVRRTARELGVDLSRVKGSGVKGRITADDVKAWVKQALSAATPAKSGGAGAAASGGGLPKIPDIDFSKFGAVEFKPLGRIQKISGPRLHASWVNVPHVWQMDEADITDLEDTRKKLKDEAAAKNIKLTPLAFIIRAVVNALKEYPNFNSSLDPSGQSIILKKYMNIGFAADTPNGLMVPVIKDADQKDIYDIARDLASLSEKSRDGKLSGADVQGGCFTISSLGGIGGTSFTPIINAPEVAILGVAKSSMKPVFNAKSGGFDARLILPFTLAFDHRVVDGALAARFTTYLAKQLADVKTLLMAVPK